MMLDKLKSFFYKVFKDPFLPFYLLMALIPLKIAGILKLTLATKFILFLCFFALLYFYSSIILPSVLNNLVFQIYLFLGYVLTDYYLQSFVRAVIVLSLFCFYPFVLLPPAKIYKIYDVTVATPDLEYLTALFLIVTFFRSFDRLVVESEFLRDSDTEKKYSELDWNLVIVLINKYFKGKFSVTNRISPFLDNPLFSNVSKRYIRTDAFKILSESFQNLTAGITLTSIGLVFTALTADANNRQAEASLRQAVVAEKTFELNKMDIEAKVLMAKAEARLLEAKAEAVLLEAKARAEATVLEARSKTDIVNSTLTTPEVKKIYDNMTLEPRPKKGWLWSAYEENFSHWFFF